MSLCVTWTPFIFCPAPFVWYFPRGLVGSYLQQSQHVLLQGDTSEVQWARTEANVPLHQVSWWLAMSTPTLWSGVSEDLLDLLQEAWETVRRSLSDCDQTKENPKHVWKEMFPKMNMSFVESLAEGLGGAWTAQTELRVPVQSETPRPSCDAKQPPLLWDMCLQWASPAPPKGVICMLPKMWENEEALFLLNWLRLGEMQASQSRVFPEIRDHHWNNNKGTYCFGVLN